MRDGIEAVIDAGVDEYILGVLIIQSDRRARIQSVKRRKCRYIILMVFIARYIRRLVVPNIPTAIQRQSPSWRHEEVYSTTHTIIDVRPRQHYRGRRVGRPLH